MYRTEIERYLSQSIRDQVDQLIHRTWSYEASETGDVEMLANAESGVDDPIDQLSLHVMIKDDLGRLVGYGRVAVTTPEIETDDILSELKLPTYLNTNQNGSPIAYISRLVVDPAHRGRGIASLIHKTRIKVATQLGAQAIYGWAVGEKPRNALAQIGFEEVLERDGFRTPWYRTQRTTRLVRYELAQANATAATDWPMASSN